LEEILPIVKLQLSRFSFYKTASSRTSGRFSEISGHEAVSVNIWAIAGFSGARISLFATSSDHRPLLFFCI
jgi:hypothetical protein